MHTVIPQNGDLRIIEFYELHIITYHYFVYFLTELYFSSIFTKITMKNK